MFTVQDERSSRRHSVQLARYNLLYLISFLPMATEPCTAAVPNWKVDEVKQMMDPPFVFEN